MTQLDDIYEPLELPPAKVSSDKLGSDVEAIKEVLAPSDGTIVIRPRPARFKDAWLPMCIVGFVIAAIIIGGALFIGSFRMGYVVAIAAACFVFQSFIGWIMYMRQRLHARDGPYAVFTPSQKYVDLLHAPGKPRVHYTSIRGFRLTFVKTSSRGDGPLYQLCAVDETNQSHLIFVTRWRGEFHRILRELEQHGMPMSDPPVVEPPRLVHDGEVVAGWPAVSRHRRRHAFALQKRQSPPACGGPCPIKRGSCFSAAHHAASSCTSTSLF